MDSIQVQRQDFNLAEEYHALSRDPQAGAIALFVGQVRDMNLGSDVQALELEHYPGMTERSLQHIVNTAHQRWQLTSVRVIHRYGYLNLGEQIVLVGVSSVHRQSAFDACQFIMDWLKTDAPFWKKEHTRDGQRWLEAKACDQQARDKWLDSHE
ncbi:molybdopterin synthase catalytic subunit [Bacterioplanes sanyensis]|uniref:molybdopterin synthase catalytic subunit MoaE n=1 Tax=Bacterioplanes sanyensis TaxID=1249553 RepID=UPI00167756A4|nr:molybdopterin synthase catalytic subunit MoaE [Bacterioplanes sanyensis]GGY53277.1 molybdopterin synthase catalytic subunit [Bacterioplanes sanyensis]